ncbi:MAG: serine hydrolase [Thermoanaerobaculia bacterium]
MRILRFAVLALIAFPLFGDYKQFLDVPRDPSLETKLRMAAEASVKAYPKLKSDDLAITLLDLSDPQLIGRADFHGDAPFYPASVIKLFFMADTFATKKESVPDVDRALREMISISDNDATAYIVDILANTTPGPSLQGRALARYIDKRREINKRFQKLGYANNVSAMMKPWSFGPYGVDLQVLGTNRENRNMLTSNATASLLLWIVRRRAPGAEAEMTLLARPLSPLREEENQVKEFIGEALPADAKLWSKAGWTSEVRHDAAYFELPNGKKYVLVIFTRGAADDVTLIPAIAKNVLGELAVR